MQAILDLQKMDAPINATALGDSCTSSDHHCCNDEVEEN